MRNKPGEPEASDRPIKKEPLKSSDPRMQEIFACMISRELLAKIQASGARILSGKEDMKVLAELEVFGLTNFLSRLNIYPECDIDIDAIHNIDDLILKIAEEDQVKLRRALVTLSDILGAKKEDPVPEDPTLTYKDIIPKNSGDSLEKALLMKIIKIRLEKFEA